MILRKEQLQDISGLHQFPLKSTALTVIVVRDVQTGMSVKEKPVECGVKVRPVCEVRISISVKVIPLLIEVKTRFSVKARLVTGQYINVRPVSEVQTS